MARYAVVTWGGAGNQTPALGLATALKGRGHTVVFAGYPDQRARFESLGFQFRVLQRAQHAWPTTPPDDWMPALVDAVWACPSHLSDIADLVDAERCDALLVDCLMFGALAAAQRLSVPTAVLVHSAPGALVPPGGGLDGLALDRVNQVRAAAGLVGIETLWDAWRPFLTLCTSIPELDPLADQLPSHWEFVGPVFEPHHGPRWQPPWPDGDARPLALVSFSTGQAWDQSTRIARTLAALADGDYRVLVTTGPASCDRMRVPGNATVVPFAPHGDVLPHAAVTVTHAGHGTVAASLAHAVPIVGLPNAAADQPALAHQVARLGAGIALDGDAATPDEIAAAVDRATADSAYTVAAGRLGRVIDSMPGPEGAAQRLWQLATAG